MIPLANHVWQSTIFAVAAALLTLALRRNRAQTRYWVWLTASAKFLFPFSLLVALGSRFESKAPRLLDPRSLSVAVEQVSQPFSAQLIPFARQPTIPVLPMLLGAVWVCGFAAVLFVWYSRWRRIQTLVRASARLPLSAPIPAFSAPGLLEPGVFGILRPVLLLPAGIADRLSPAQLQAILAHELCHVRRRDNLAAAGHMLVEAIFWFHPLVWWIGARLVEERERACDEEVLRQGSEPDVYAEGILNVCKFYLESPLACASGITGADLRKRIEAILTNRTSRRLTWPRKILLAAAGALAVAGPMLIGVVNAPRGRAQSLKFEVASIKPTPPGGDGSLFSFVPGGGIEAHNVTLLQLVTFAYDLRDFQVTGGPGWVRSERYEILAKPEHLEGPSDFRHMTDSQREIFMGQTRTRVQALLVERFQLTIHKELKELPTYAMTVAKGGVKMQESKETEGNRGLRTTRGKMTGQRASMATLVNVLSGMVGRPVLDRTGLTAGYDFELTWSPEPHVGPPGAPGEPVEPPDTSGPSIFTAVQEQLGLKFESQKGPVETIVIDRAEKASEN